MKGKRKPIRPASGFDPKPYRSAMFRAKNKRLHLNNIKISAPISHIPFIIEDLCKVPAFRVYIIRNFKPASAAEITEQNPLAQVDLEREIVWNVSVFLSISDEIKEFIILEKKYNHALLSRKFDDAIGALDDIQERFGYSFWLISAYLSTFSESGLTDRRAEFTSEILKEKAKGFISYFSYHIYRRGDRSVNPSEYIADLSKELDGIDVSDELREHLKTLLLPVDDGLLFDGANTLAYDEASPVVDRYHSLLNTLVRACEQDFFQQRQNFSKIVFRLGAYLEDPRLLAICDHLFIKGDDDQKSTVYEDSLQAVEMYTQGNYTDALDILCNILLAEPTQVALWEISAKCIARTGLADAPAGVPHPVLDMARVHLRGEGFHESQARLERFALMDCYRPASLAVRSFLERESWNRWSDETTIRDSRVALLCGVVTPWYRRALLEWCGRDRAQPSLASPTPLSDSLQGLGPAAGGGEVIGTLPIPLGRRALYAGSEMAKSGKAAQAASALEQALTDEYPPTRFEAAKRLVDIYLTAERYSDALELVGEIYATNQTCANIFNVKGILDKIEDGKLSDCYSSVGLPITYDIYSRTIGPDRDPAKADAAEEFAVSMGVDLPSQLPSEALSDAPSTLYYLEHVCTTSTLEAFVNIDSSNQVEMERVAICQILTDLNPLSGSRYASEITDITRRQVVKDRLKQVEQSKIYVDLQNIRKKANVTIKDQFARYQSMMASPEYTDTVLKVLKTIKEQSGQRELKFQIVSAASNPLQVAFEQLVRDVFVLLVTSREHGLETYLSTRIRHGTLAGHIRSPLEVHRVITQKADSGTSYRPDEHWTAALQLPDHVSEIISDLLKAFSEKIDSTIDLLNKSWIQILDADHPEGMFDFRTFRNDLYNLRVDIELDTEFGAFLDSVIELFWKSTEANLSAIRRRIKGEFRDRITAAFDDLHREATETLPAAGFSGFFAALTAARTDVQNAIDGVAGWFQVTDRLEYPDYSFDIAVEVAAKSVESSFRHMPIKLTTSLDVARDLRGDTLSSVVDLLFILLENAVTKSHLGRGPSVTVRAIGEGNALLLEVENEISPVSDPEVETAALKERVEFSETTATRQLVAREGGSGFPKIMRIITHDLQMKHNIDARYSARDRFRVGLSLHDGEIFV